MSASPPASRPTPPAPTHRHAVLEALLVTFLWSTSWVLIKLGLRAELPSLTFAGLRYCLAFLCLLPWLLISPQHRAALGTLSYRDWAQLLLYGIVFYALAQGAQFFSLGLLPWLSQSRESPETSKAKAWSRCPSNHLRAWAAL